MIPKYFLISLILILFVSSGWAAESSGSSAFEHGLQFETKMELFPACHEFKKAIEAEPQNAGYVEHYAWFLFLNSFHEEAAISFEKLIQLKNGKVSNDVYRAIGWCEKEMGRLDKSLAAYSKVYQLPKESMHAALEMIDRQLAADSLKKAESFEKRGVQGAERKEFFQELVYAHRYKKAWKLGANLRKEYPNDINFHYQYARSLFWGGKLERAECEYQKLIRKSPRNAFFYYELGKIQNGLRERKKAEASFKRASELEPHFALAERELAAVVAVQNRPEEARRIADRIKNEKTNQIPFLLSKAQARHFSGDLRRAIPYYEALLEKFPENQEALAGVTECYIYTENYKRADRSFKTWEQLITDNRYVERKKTYDWYTSPTLGVKSDYYSNSVNYARINEGASFRFKPNLSSWLDIGYSFSHFDQYRFDEITRHTAFAEASYDFCPEFQVSGRLAGNFYDNDWTSLNGRAAARIRPQDWLEVNLTYDHVDIIDSQLPFANAIFNPVTTIGSVGEKLYTNDYSALIIFSPSGRLDILGKFTYGDYSDDNEKIEYFAEINYKIFQSPRLLAGLNYYYLNFENPAPLFKGPQGDITPSYYDPINFESWSARLEWVHDVNSWVQYGLENRVHYIPKSDGFADSFFAFIRVKWDDENAIRLDGRYFYQSEGVGRTGPTDSFRAMNCVLSYEHKF